LTVRSRHFNQHASFIFTSLSLLLMGG
jgi:hypothetical protein